MLAGNFRVIYLPEDSTSGLGMWVSISSCGCLRVGVDISVCCCKFVIQSLRTFPPGLNFLWASHFPGARASSAATGAADRRRGTVPWVSAAPALHGTDCGRLRAVRSVGGVLPAASPVTALSAGAPWGGGVPPHDARDRGGEQAGFSPSGRPPPISPWAGI